MFKSLRRKDSDRIRKSEEATDIRRGNEKKLEKAPWFIKLLIYIKIKLSEVEPFRIWFLVFVFILASFVFIGFMLPFITTITEIPNKIPILSAISGIMIGMYLNHIQHINSTERVCELSIGGKSFSADNKKIDIYQGGEVIYLTDYYGRPLLNKDKSDIRRYGQQRTIFIPRQVLEQFSSIQGRRAKSYPDCRLKRTPLQDIDYGILYMPKLLSETRLLKKLDVAEENISVLNEIIDKFKEQATSIARDTRGYYSELLKGFAEEMSIVQKALWGSKGTIRDEIKEAMYGRYGRHGSYYSRYSPYYGSRYESGGPDFTSFTPRSEQQQQEEVHEEEE